MESDVLYGNELLEVIILGGLDSESLLIGLLYDEESLIEISHEL